ncbi:MAG: arginine--tRNA ligase [Candidatus Micrarchaeota archaeon]
MENINMHAKTQARKHIHEAMNAAFGIGFPMEQIEITDSSDCEHGDLSTPVCFKLARELKKSPHDIAKKIEPHLKQLLSGGDFSNANALNGFLNLSFSDKYFLDSVKCALGAGKNFGRNDFGEGKKAIVEYSSPNIGKPMHIGHIRSTILGDAVARALRFCGYKVISSNYLCEAGLQTAKLLLSVRLFGKEKIATEKDLLELYVKIHREMENKPELEAQAQELVLKMELGDEAVLKQLSKIRSLSTLPFEKNYKRLNVVFDEEVYDSDYVPFGKALAKEALLKGIAFQDKNGETVADLGKHSLPNLIIVRSNGTTLYSTRDLGLADRDYNKYKFDARIYVTASEQNLHFQQVFAILRALEKPYADRLKHIGFGLISLEEGKLSTREGRVLLLEDVINDAVALALREVLNRQEYSEKDAGEISEIVGVASLKYSVLRISSEKDIKFSMQEAVKFDGNTAAYLQYTAVRAKNIIRRASAEKIKIAGEKSGGYAHNQEEKKLISLISQFPNVTEHAARQLIPYTICDYLFKLALQFSAFYNASPVLKAETAEARAARLRIVEATGIVMQNGLGLLGIGIPDKM